jgi:hypothetical protein
VSDDVDEAAVRSHLAQAREALANPYTCHGPARSALEQLIADVEALLAERSSREE